MRKIPDADIIGDWCNYLRYKDEAEPCVCKDSTILRNVQEDNDILETALIGENYRFCVKLINKRPILFVIYQK